MHTRGMPNPHRRGRLVARHSQRPVKEPCEPHRPAKTSTRRSQQDLAQEKIPGIFHELRDKFAQLWFLKDGAEVPVRIYYRAETRGKGRILQLERVDHLSH